MLNHSNNIIQLLQLDTRVQPTQDIFVKLSHLLEQHIFPLLETLPEKLISEIEAHMESAVSDNELMEWVELKSTLNSSSQKIQNHLKKELVSFCAPPLPTPHKKHSSNLALLDNEELDHTLTWLSAAEAMESNNNRHILCQIRSRFKSSFPEYAGAFPTTPEKLCESFSKAITLLSPSPNAEQLLLLIFIHHIQQPADQLWIEADELLNNEGFFLPSKETDSNDTSPASAGKASLNTLVEEPSKLSAPFDEQLLTDNPSFMDNLAEKLVHRLEDMLVQDEIIPNAKANRVKVADLTGALTTIKLEVDQQHSSIQNLNEQIKKALASCGISKQLSRHHEDLINMVGMLFEYILDDHQLPEELKKVIALLQIPVLKQAVIDDSFLSDRHHPARELLNVMTRTGLQYYQQREVSEHVLVLIEHTVRTIISGFSTNKDIFGESLKVYQLSLEQIVDPGEKLIVEPNDPVEKKDDMSSLQDNSQPLQRSNLPEYQGPSEGMSEEIVLENQDSPEIDSIGTNSPEDSLRHQDIDCPLHIKGLQPGQWVEFIGDVDNHRLRCKLARIDRKNQHFIFVNQAGMKVAERSAYQLSHEINQGGVQIIDELPIFDRAIQAVKERLHKKE